MHSIAAEASPLLRRGPYGRPPVGHQNKLAMLARCARLIWHSAALGLVTVTSGQGPGPGPLPDHRLRRNLRGFDPVSLHRGIGCVPSWPRLLGWSYQKKCALQKKDRDVACTTSTVLTLRTHWQLEPRDCPSALVGLFTVLSGEHRGTSESALSPSQHDQAQVPRVFKLVTGSPSPQADSE